MNKAWLVRDYHGGEWQICFDKPESWHSEVKEIVWSEIKEGKPE